MYKTHTQQEAYHCIDSECLSTYADESHVRHGVYYCLDSESQFQHIRLETTLPVRLMAT